MFLLACLARFFKPSRWLAYGFGVLSCCVAVGASAHVKWFIVDPGAFSYRVYPLDSLTFCLIALALLFIVFAVALDRLGRRHKQLQRWLYGPLSSRIPALDIANWPIAVLKLTLAVMLLVNLLQGHFIAPHFVANPDDTTYVLLQAGLLLILVLTVTGFAVSLLVVCTVLLFVMPLDSTIDYCPEFIAIALALYLNAEPRRQRNYQINWLSNTYRVNSAELGLSCLRFGLGLQLIILTLHDKLLSPGYGLAFLADYPYFNFLKYIGIASFDDIYFVLSAGLAELCFGVLLVSNIVPRLALALILFFFTLSGLVLGLEELVGHLPILAAALILLVYLPQRVFTRVDEELPLLADY